MTRSLAPLALVLIGLLGLGESVARAAPPGRIAVLTPQRASDDRLACASLVLADGLTEALAGRVGDAILEDRPLVRALERDGAPTGADLEIQLTVTAKGVGFEVRAPALATLTSRTFSGEDPLRLVSDLADAISGALDGGSAASHPVLAFPTGAACAELARAWELFDPADAAALAATRKALEAALRDAPGDARVLALLAEINVRAGATDKGLALADEALAAAPDLAEAHFARGLGHDYADHPELALAAYREAAQRSAGVLAARVNAGLIELRAHHLSAALALLDEASRRAPTWFVGQFNRAVALVDAGDGRAALAALANVQAPARFSGERVLLEAAARLLSGEAADVIRLAEPLVADPSYGARARAFVARALALGPDRARALTALDAALAEPAAAKGRLMSSLVVARARTLVAAGRKDEALARLRELAAADRAFEAPLIHRALVAFGGADRDVLEALVAKVPDDHEGWFDLGVLRQKAGDLEGAATAYERAAEDNPRALWALYNRALVALAQNDARGAVTWLEAASRIHAEDADVVAALAAARARL